MSEAIEPFRIEVPDRDVRDLRARLRATRWPSTFADPAWEAGVDPEFARRACHYWADGYDWRHPEDRLNGFPQYRTRIDGANVHFLHVRSPDDGAMPLAMTHGWPGSIAEFVKVIGPLADPGAHGGRRQDAFHVVCPSIPGFGFSGPAPGPGWDTRRVAAAPGELMTRLGYERFVAQGGEYGASISSWLSHLAPERVIGHRVAAVGRAPLRRRLLQPAQPGRSFRRL
jgi:hypothetical protein